MEIRKYKLDKEKSREIYDNNREYIKIKDCYRNVFHLVTEYMLNFKSNKWHIAYGYVSTAFDNLLCRHCFILDENDMVIDSTLFARDIESIEKTFYAIYIFQNVSEYLKAINNEGGYPALIRYLKSYDDYVRIWAENNSFILVS